MSTKTTVTKTGDTYIVEVETGPRGPAGLPGPAGEPGPAGPTGGPGLIVRHMTLAQWAALPAEEQIDPLYWFVICEDEETP